VAIVRLSGDRLDKLLEPLIQLPAPTKLSPRRLKWGGYAENALVVYFQAPNSYTGEDIVEFHLHGNPLLARRFLECLGQMGARLAAPGEFTQRALLNGKQNLLDVEALQDLMDAATDAQIREAQARAGGAPAWVLETKEQIAKWVSMVEAAVDYGEDEGIVFGLGELKKSAAAMRATFHVEQERSASARWLRDGIRIVIVGRPNAGKSTLFNLLSKEERAIVAESPGTTRDILEAKCEWAGLPLFLFDTAGIRLTEDPVENMGIARIGPLLQQSDLILHLVPVFDAGADPEALKHLAPYQAKVLEIRNQSDLAECEGICVSAATNNLSQLEAALKNRFLGEFSPDACLGALATARQRELLADLTHQMGLIADLPNDTPPELPASLLQGAWGLLARLTGEDRADMTLDAMFSRFCLGK
jgi:tRNA modification GTPase